MIERYRASALAIVGTLSFSYLIANPARTGGSFAASLVRSTDPLAEAIGRTPLVMLVFAAGLLSAWLLRPRRPAPAEEDFERQRTRQRGAPDPVLDALRLARFEATAEAEQAAAATRDAVMVGLDSGEADFTRKSAALPVAEPLQVDPGPAFADAAERAAIEAARGRPIVFRELYPPPIEPGLSFYGGLPIAPAGLTWPRAETKSGEKSLSFIMQWDCAELAGQDPTGLLPDEGALYLFCDLEWGVPLAFRFIHVPGPVAGWCELAPPADLPPVYGEEGAWLIKHCAQVMPAELQGVPRLLPKWPFRPAAFDYPRADERDGEDDERAFWADSPAVKDALLAVQNSLGAPLSAFEPSKSVPFARPFNAFPHDWAAVRVVCVEAIDRLRRPGQPSRGFMPDASEDERAAAIAKWLDEAKDLYTFAAGQPETGAVPQDTADDIWSWIERLEGVVRLGFARAVEQCVNTSLGLGSEAAGAIPSELVAENWRQHALALEYMREEFAPRGKPAEMEAFSQRQQRGELAQFREVHAPSPNRMFGPPSYVQGYIEERTGDWLVLLELSGNEAVGHHFGDGVFQFVIRPRDLAQRRFDRVEAILSAY